ncbi:FAD-binding oxidoreductase [Novosphingobium sp. 1949]|uniref:FAD-binding oxidoreductase n=1 Tax=Novosphingobium organovorum TaxID=2930092 RepID=A0ABT0BBG8_9SPHN|nr:FAD-binding oxidoreductase [Novosphingobium organovorum]MCJ2182161.1 FAD-binding oxidoreductase [Novosphingobium organovorum]
MTHEAGMAAAVRQDAGARDYAATSYWLETAGETLTPRRALAGDITVDVAILGAGFSALWTALHLLRLEPGLDIALVERDVAGFGASGRNGGWCSPRFPLDADVMARRFGGPVARRTLLALEDAVERIGATCEEERIEAHFRKTGLLNLARSERQMGLLVKARATAQALGFGEDARLLDADEAFARVHATKVHGGLLSSAGAAVHPGRLVRGLARAVERRGAVIYEQTRVLRCGPGENPVLETDRGTVRARRAVVMAGEAYLPQQPGWQRALVPMSSMIVLTEPLSPAIWDAIGWTHGESLCSQVNIKNYLTRTHDGRILFGSRGAPYLFGSATPEAATRNEAIFAWMRQTARAWWPVLENVEFTHAWGGYLGVPRDWLPTVAFDEGTRIAALHGYTGRGVSTSELAGRLMAARLLGRETGLEDLPFHTRAGPRWEPEPLRWAGIRYVNNAFTRMDAADERGGHAPFDARFAKSLGGQK